MAIIYGFGELALYEPARDKLEVLCAADFSLQYVQSFFEYQYFDSINQVYKDSGKPIITSESYSLSLTFEEFDLKILDLIFGSNVAFKAQQRLEFTGTAFLTDGPPVLISAKNIVPISMSELTVGTPVTVDFECEKPPSYSELL